MAFYGGKHPDAGFPEATPPGPEARFDPESATPDQVIDHYRGDILFGDLPQFEKRLRRKPDLRPEERRVETLDHMCRLTEEAVHYVLQRSHDPARRRYHPSQKPAETFLNAVGSLLPEDEPRSAEDVAYEQLDRRRGVLHRAYYDALALQQEHVMGKTKNRHA